MKDLQIIVVSWNVEKLLERCLASLPGACEGLDWEVVVIDNASKDQSVATAKRFSFVRVISNSENCGFAKAVNQGMEGSEAKFVLLLNPDTECPPGSLARLVEIGEAHPKAGIIGPALQYPDGSPQQSVRAFPTVWSQLGILLKLHHVMPWLPTFRNYFGRNQKGELPVDQVMGACFLIRRELIEQIGGLDERYFIWFEEVDYCREAKKRGWEILFTPKVNVVHHMGTSFAQHASVQRQKMFNRSLITYFAKWHPGWRARLIQLAAPVSIALAWVIDSFNRPERKWFGWMIVIAMVEFVSALTVFHPLPRSIVAGLLAFATFVIAWKRPSLGMAILATELLIGSKGALFKWTLSTNPDAGVSIRILMTAAFLLGWTLNVMSKDVWTRVRNIACEIWKRKAWFAVLLLSAWGIIRGIWLQNEKLPLDVNAWFYLAMLFPVVDIARRDGERLVRLTSQAMIAALLWLPIKTLAMLYVWSHGIKSLSQPLYLWVRRTGVGEVTLVTGNLFRVFIQSQVYALTALLVATARVIEERRRRTRRLVWALIVASVISILISLSRSFWIGLFAGGGCLLLMSFLRRQESILDRSIRSWIPAFARMTTAVVAALLILFATVAFPYPRIDVGSLKTLFGSRGSTSDAAAESRWNLLPVLEKKIREAPILGSGFGASVTYQSKDPRVLANNPDGMYTTYAFEWGWLEHWIKFGIVGIPIMGWLVLSLIHRIWKTDTPWWQRAGFVSSLVTLAILHVFTPYLNHPLGFGFLLAMEGWVTAKRQTVQA